MKNEWGKMVGPPKKNEEIKFILIGSLSTFLKNKFF